MKKLLLVLIIGTLFSIGAVSAQGGFGQRVTMEERVKRITSKLDSAFKLDTQRLSAVDTALKVLFKAQDAKRQEMMSGGGMPDRELMMAEMKKFSDAQDAIIEAVLSKEEFGIWKEKIQPSMRPRGMGGPGGPGGGQFRERNNQ
ncbi:MAG: hypothetical protein RIQ34_88 [Bacteroidota bacterium]|jgi:hypothetical protein